MITIHTEDGIAVLTFDQPDSKLNIVTPELFKELGTELERLGADPAVQGVVLASAKPGCFLAGADLKAMKALQVSSDAVLQGEAMSREGQVFMDFIEGFRVPVAAAVGGVCFGGGTELALACRYRIAATEESTRLGLPEVKLGILPAWGGSYRLPRLVGVPAALDLMTTGRELNARQAYRIGLVDELVPSAVLAGSARTWLARVLKTGDAGVLARRRKVRGPLGRFLIDMNPVGRTLACALARRAVIKKTRGAYPAPLAITRIVANQGWISRRAALGLEAHTLGSLLGTSEAKNLLGVFFLTQEGKSAGPKAAPRPVSRAGVVGGGLMGSGIATVFANREIPVRLKDISAAEVGKALKAVADHFRSQAQRRRLTPLAARERLDAVSSGTTYDGFAQADVVVEAVPEILDLKCKVFGELEDVVRPDAVLASNTSTLPIIQISEGLKHPERAVGMHFFFPAPRMPLVEVIPSAKTAPEVTATIVALARRCGKTAVVVKDAPGFLVNRILMPYMIEAFFMLQEGATVAEVDGAAEEFGMPMGPVRLAGEVGLAVVHKAGQVILAAFSNRLETPKLADAMTQQPGLFVQRGRDKLPVASAIEALARAQGTPARPHPREEIRDRLILSMANEAAYCLAEDVVASPALLDLALITGIGFPPFRGGLCRYLDSRGAADVVQALESLAGRAAKRFVPAPFLTGLARSGKKLYSP